MDHKSREYEEQRLADTIAFAAARAEAAGAALEVLSEKVQDMITHYNDDNFDLFSDIVVSLDRQAGLADLVDRCQRAVKKPYFGRVDFAEAGKPLLELYIGRGGLYDDEAGQPVVIDWRTPIANLYYDAELGPASYTSQGDTYTGEMHLKRTYNIADGKLNDYYDADLVTNDELLQAYLAKNADAVLRDIVATIQKDQNDIIRIEPWYDVVVQGVAGSGKTTVAMHRLAYLIFNYAKDTKPDQYAVIGTNRMFLHYVSGMLPDLGVQAVTQMTMPELLAAYLDFREPVASGVNKNAPERASRAFFEDLRAYMDAFERDLLLHELSLGGKVIIAEDELTERILGGKKKTLLERAELLNEFVSGRVQRLRPALENALEAACEDGIFRFKAGEAVGGYTSTAEIIDAKYAALEELAGQAKQLRNIYIKKINGLKEKRIYADFLKARGLRPAKQRDVYDLAAMAYIASRLRPKKKSLRHIIVDEAQDFGPMLYMCLTELYPGATFTILGDVMQNIGDGVGITDWDEVLDAAFSARRSRFCVLAKSYRNTVEIAELANRVAARSDSSKYKAVPVVRHGDPVTFSVLPSPAALEAEAVAEAKRRQQGSLALICPDAAAARRLGEKLPGVPLITADGGETRYEGGVTIFDADSVKGLEFDRVVVCGVGSEDYPDTPRTIRLLYVVLTRALHELRVLAVEGSGGLLAPGT